MTSSALGPESLGSRVVVRRRLPGQTGPSGGAAMTDVLGILEAWTADAATVRTDRDDLVRIPLAEIVAGKQVPARRQRRDPEEAERRAVAGWPAVVSAPLGPWLLRGSGGFSSRANSVLAVGDPSPDLVREVVAFYRAQGLEPLAQVVVGSASHHLLEDAGWEPARPGQADSLFMMATIGTTRPDPDISLAATVSELWLANDERARSFPEASRAVLEGPATVVFASLIDDGALLAKGRVSVTDGWAGLTDIWVDPSRRGSGLGRRVVSALLDTAASRGASTAYLQTSHDNPVAVRLYERLGFTEHHTYRYLREGR